VLVVDQRPPQRDHHQNTQQAAEHRDHRHPPDLKVEPEDKYRRHRHADTERDRFTRRPRRLNDIVFENGRVARPELRQDAEQRYRNDRNRYRRRNGQADLQHKIKRRRAEDYAEKRADDERHGREFAQACNTRRNIRPKILEKWILHSKDLLSISCANAGRLGNLES
jgi:hypothetical protein